MPLPSTVGAITTSVADNLGILEPCDSVDGHTRFDPSVSVVISLLLLLGPTDVCLVVL